MNFKAENISEHPIDAVILWVDGSDPLHQQKMKPFLEDKSKLNKKSFRTRFDQVEEVQFLVNSILKFAPYIRNIFLVTDNQIPNFLKGEKLDKKYEKLKIIDHKEIFVGFEQYLPIFNSISIETMLFKIPDLSEHFIYLNDDFFFINNSNPSDFFIDGKPVLRGKWGKFNSQKWHKIFYKKIVHTLKKGPENNKFGYKIAQQNAAREVGFDKYLRLNHTPSPMRKSTIENFFNKKPDKLISNISHKFRNSTYFMIQSLADHLEIQQNNYIVNCNYQLCYIQSYKKPLLWYKFKLYFNKKHKKQLFLCLQSLDQCPPKKLNFLINWLTKLVI